MPSLADYNAVVSQIDPTKRYSCSPTFNGATIDLEFSVGNCQAGTGPLGSDLKALLSVAYGTANGAYAYIKTACQTTGGSFTIKEQHRHKRRSNRHYRYRHSLTCSASGRVSSSRLSRYFDGINKLLRGVGKHSVAHKG